MTSKTPPIALTIAGSDSGGGAGIQADLKTFAAFEIFGTSVITLITAQNTRGVTALEVLPENLVAAQFQAVVTDLTPRAAKTGALGSVPMIDRVSALLRETPIEDLVVDPVMISKHGIPLLSDEGGRRIRDHLLPLALVVTPNRFEAAVLTGMGQVESVQDMKEAARRLFDFGARHVIVKGAHFDRVVRDLCFDGSGFVEFGADRVDSEHVHGSGCTFSAAITARLAHGDPLLEAVGTARAFISGAIANAPALGHGISPVHPMHLHWS
jgi:hydroxymethylpyrimidine/phosphomethylpyrimidine kinase